MTTNQPAQTAQAKALYAAGQLAFERGNYREAITALEEGIRLVGKATPLGGSIQLWLVNAYAAASRHQDAIALGEILAKHPDLEVRKQSKRVVDILKAPQLRRPKDWVVSVPDMSQLDRDEGELKNLGRYGTRSVAPKPAPPAKPVPDDLDNINTQENGFVWLCLAAIALALGSLWLFR